MIKKGTNIKKEPILSTESKNITIQAKPDSEKLRKHAEEQIREESLELESLRTTGGVEFQSYDTLLFKSYFGGSLRDDGDFLKSIDKVVELYSNRSSSFEKNGREDYTDNELKYMQVISEMVKVLHPPPRSKNFENKEQELLWLIVAMARIMHPQESVENKNRKWTPIVYAVLNAEIYRLCELLNECSSVEEALKKIVQEQPLEKLIKS